MLKTRILGTSFLTVLCARIPTVISTRSHFSLLQVPATAQATSAESNASVDKLGSSKVITRTKLSCACLIYVAGTMFDFLGLIFRKTFTHVLNSSHLRLLRLLQTHQSQQTSLLKSAAVPR